MVVFLSCRLLGSILEGYIIICSNNKVVRNWDVGRDII